MKGICNQVFIIGNIRYHLEYCYR